VDGAVPTRTKSSSRGTRLLILELFILDGKAEPWLGAAFCATMVVKFGTPNNEKAAILSEMNEMRLAFQTKENYNR